MRLLSAVLLALLTAQALAQSQQTPQTQQPPAPQAAPQPAAAAPAPQAELAQQAAPDSRPSPESLRKLFAVMHTNSLLDNLMAQIDSSSRTALMQSLAGKPLNDAQRKIIQDSQLQLQELTRSELSWGKLEPMIIEVYRDNLTQGEVDGMVRFFQSESGRAVIAKMPAIYQAMMAKMQVNVRSLTPKIAELQKHTMAQLIEASDTGPARAPAAPPPAPASPGAPPAPATPAPQAPH
jgi:uncharacterized protein